MQANKSGLTVAHFQAKNGYKFDPVRDKEILILANNDGYTVAHEQVLQGYFFDLVRDKDILKISDSTGETVAWQQIRNMRTEELRELKEEEIVNVLKLTANTKTGDTIAHMLIRKRRIKIKEIVPNHYKEIFMLTNNDAWTVAHEQVSVGYYFDPVKEREILMLKDKNGQSVAHIQASRGYIFDVEGDKEILELTNNDGVSVEEIRNEKIIEILINGNKDKK
jgi:GH15 family glucan-1,4-alpha-glucosidase